METNNVSEITKQCIKILETYEYNNLENVMHIVTSFEVLSVIYN